MSSLSTNPDLLLQLSQFADQADQELQWPEQSWELLKQIGATAWSIPESYDGQGCSTRELMQGYEHLSRSCLTSCFLLSQRDAAVRRLLNSNREDLCEELLPQWASGETFATIGIAQLTTSRQHTSPAMQVELQSNQIQLNGSMPWVSGAAKAGYFITGGVTDKGQQVLVLLPASSDGVQVQPPLELMALRGSITSTVSCENVVIDERWKLGGPAERVLSPESSGGLMTSTLALGLAGAAVDYLKQECESRSYLQPVTERFESMRNQLWQNTLELADQGSTPEQLSQLRANANICVLQVTQCVLTVAKGTGFVYPHPAQRWARQAMFFLVWSCPRPTTEVLFDWFMPINDSDSIGQCI